MKNLNLRFMQTLLMCAVLSFLCESCSAQGKRSNGVTFAPVDSIIRAELSDSVSSIVLNPKAVIVQRLKVDKGKIKIIESCKLSRSEIGIASFQMATIEKNDTTSVVYGRFIPNVRYVFKSGKAQIWVDADFGLGKIYFKNSKGDIIKRFDITDKNLLKFSSILFKEDEFLIHILKTK